MIINALDRLLAFLLITVLLFVVPVYYQYQRQEDINYQLIWLEVQKTADLICELGYVEENSLTGLQALLGATGASYRITLSHLRKSYVENESDEEMLIYYAGDYNAEIYRQIRENGRYKMDLGDFFYISVENTSKTPFQQLKAALGFRQAGVTMVARSGGLIRAEGL